MLITPYYSTNKKSLEEFSTPYCITIKLVNSPHSYVRNQQTTLVAKKIYDHMVIIEESRKFIKEGASIYWNEYAKAK